MIMRRWVNVCVLAVLVFLPLRIFALENEKESRSPFRWYRKVEEKRVDLAQPQKDPVWAKEDVIYLKNGAIFRGIIAERQADEKVRIQTRGGNLIVFGMDEVERITEEEPFRSPYGAPGRKERAAWPYSSRSSSVDRCPSRGPANGTTVR